MTEERAESIGERVAIGVQQLVRRERELQERVSTHAPRADARAHAGLQHRPREPGGNGAVRKGAKQSVAAFKVRQGDTVGVQITLRGKRMYDFLDKLINIALPRTKDFRGISANGIDEMGNYTLGIKENTIFPESSDEDLKDVFGLAITVVTNVHDPKETKAFLLHLGFPFKKDETAAAKPKAGKAPKQFNVKK